MRLICSSCWYTIYLFSEEDGSVHDENSMLMLSKEGLIRKQLIYLSILNYFISSVAGNQWNAPHKIMQNRGGWRGYVPEICGLPYLFHRHIRPGNGIFLLLVYYQKAFSILWGQEEGRVVNQNDVLFVAADGPLNLHGG